MHRQRNKAHSGADSSPACSRMQPRRLTKRCNTLFHRVSCHRDRCHRGITAAEYPRRDGRLSRQRKEHAGRKSRQCRRSRKSRVAKAARVVGVALESDRGHVTPFNRKVRYFGISADAASARPRKTPSFAGSVKCPALNDARINSSLLRTFSFMASP